MFDLVDKIWLDAVECRRHFDLTQRLSIMQPEQGCNSSIHVVFQTSRKLPRLVSTRCTVKTQEASAGASHKVGHACSASRLRT